MKETLVPLTQAIVALQIEVARLHITIGEWKSRHSEFAAELDALSEGTKTLPQILEGAQQKAEFLEALFRRMHEPPRQDELQGLLQAATLEIRF